VRDDDLALIREAFELLDSTTYEQLMPLVAADFEMATPAAIASEPDVYRGPDGVRRWWESFLEVMEWVRLDADRFEPAGEGRAIVEFRILARGRTSGIETSQAAVGIATVRDSQLVRLEFFNDLKQARAAAGLPPG